MVFGVEMVIAGLGCSWWSFKLSFLVVFSLGWAGVEMLNAGRSFA